MATYSIKLCDHTGPSNKLQSSIQGELQGFFTRVFTGTSDTATVSWGTGSASDSIVVHFVPSRASGSYIAQWLGAKKLDDINEYAGGHTTLHHHVICTEIYQTVALPPPRGGSKTLSARDYARLAFHECLHNVFPAWKETDLMGHGGLADTPVGADLSQWDIQTLRQGIAITTTLATQKL
jgi:hypothetical protein